MPLLDFDPNNKTESGLDYPKLKLEVGERARILCIEKAPTYAYTHTLRAPKIVNDVAVKHTQQRKDGSSFTDYVKEFVGQPQCLGDLGVLKDKGVDPKNCPLCARSAESSEIEQPKHRFAMHVVKYHVKPGGWELRSPFSCELVVWTFSKQMYDKLTDISTQYGSLRQRDLLLGPCTDKNYQKFEIMVAPDAAWQMSDAIGETVLATYKNNRYPGDLEIFCGRKVERAWMLNDIERIAERWRVAQRTSAPTRPDGTESAVNHALAVGLDGLDAATSQPAQTAQAAASSDKPAWLADPADAEALVAQQAAVARRATPQAPAIDFDDLLGPGTAPAETASVAPVSPAPAAASAAPSAPASASDFDFDDLLKAAG